MEKEKSFLEVVNSEKQMLALIYSKGVTQSEVLELYRKIRTGYENILLSSNQLAERQEVEYHLWKLHYKLIDEFRKRIRRQSANAENVKNETLSHKIDSQNDNGNSLEGFKSFLSGATEFYMKLIVRLRKNCGLSEEIFFNNNSRIFSIESAKLHACQYICHRLLICLGDLARYAELVKQPQACEWSNAATYYLEATRTWPDSGNPHNQLALLATYVGDAFLALYHCVRSLAVNEPFPDAWRNVMLLFEENRSTKLQSLSSQLHFDFLNPSKRSSLPDESHKEISSPNQSPIEAKLELLENACSEKFDLWPIIVRTISFFFIGSSLEELPCTLASALHYLEALLAVDDTKLTAALQSYQHMDLSRKGPYRAIQLVSIFIFIVHSLTETPDSEESTGKDDKKHSESTPLALAAMFICMGRLTERCLRGNHRDICPLLPAVLVFSEWLVDAIDIIEANAADERVSNAFSYYFDELADLLYRMDLNEDRTAPDDTPLWEDYELRGFHPLASVHEKLDFTKNLECMANFNCENQSRLQRVYHVARKIMDRAKNPQKWISKDKMGRLFDSLRAAKALEHAEVAAPMASVEVKEPDKTSEKSGSFSGPKTQLTTEEEEVILFKPITRRNSAPLYISKAPNDPVCHESPDVPKTAADEWLRRATSLSNGQNTSDNDSFSFSTTSNSSLNRSKDSNTHPTGPPSLSAWVLSSKTSNSEQDKGPNSFNKHKLTPIEEMPCASFSNLSISETKDSQVSMGHISTIVRNPSPPVTSTPSAPLLPDDAVWLKGNSLIGHESDGILGAAPTSGYTTRPAVRPPIGFGPGLTGLVDGYPPFLGMSSSEWLYHYRNSQNFPTNHIYSPLHFNAPAFGNYHQNELSGFDLFDQWGNQLVSSPMHYMGSPQTYPNSSFVYGADEQKRDKSFLGYQRSFPYVCGAGMELSSEQPPLLQYLKEKERQLQPGSQLRGPT